MKKNRGLTALLAISMLTGSITIDPQEVYAAENQDIVETQDAVQESEEPLQNEEQNDQKATEPEDNIEEEPEKVIEESDEIEEESQPDEQMKKEPEVELENDAEETETSEKAIASESFVPDEEATLANVILFVDFSKNEESYSFDEIEKLFDGSDEYKKALKPYIEGISYGKEKIQNVFPQYDSENDVIVPYILSEDELYYADHKEELVTDAEDALYAEGWTLDQLDFNKDGRIDNLMIVAVGEETWSDEDLVSGENGYSIISEQAIEDEQSGTIAHAFLLGQGYPELRDENTNNSWDIMEYIGSETPAPLVWLRQSISGWTSLKTITDSQAHVTLYADKADEQAVILKKPDSDTDILVAEYREKTDSQENGYDNEIPESELLIYRVNTAEDSAETAITWSDGSDSGIAIENVQKEETGAVTFDVNYIKPKEGLQYDAETNSWYLYKKGKIDTTYTGLAQNENGWWYVKNGKLDWNYTGLTYYYGTWYYVQKGALNWNYNGFVQHVDKKWYYVQGGKIRFDFTGLAKHVDNKWYYAEKGIINWNYTGLAKNTYNSWYYVTKGKYNPSYTGLVYYYGTWYYVQKGTLNWNYNGFVQHVDKKWYYVQGGKIRFDFTGLAKHIDNKWYYAEKGIINWNYTGLAKNTYDYWYYVKNGKYDATYTGLVYYYGTWYYVQKGTLNWNYNGFVQHVDKKWYYVQGGKIRFDFTGLAKHIDNKWYYAEKGIINWNYTGLAKNTYGYWYYVKNGQYYTGYSGLVYYNGSWFCVRSGYLDWGYTSVVKYGNDWFYVEKGKVNWGYTGPAMNENGWWYIRNGKLDWNYSGKGTYKGISYTVSKGYVTFSTGNQFYLNNCIASGYNGSQMTITLSASRNAALEQLGGQFCIIMMNSAGTQVLETLSANSSAGGSFTVSAVLKSNDSFKEAAMTQYAIGWKNGNSYQKISGTRFLGNPEITATMTKTYLGYYDNDKISSKKGMQGTSEGYTEDMAVQHALLNVDIANMVSTTKKSGYVAYTYKGKTYYFQDMIALCRTIRYLNGWDNDNPYGNHKRSVTLVLLMSWKDELAFLIHPNARQKGGAPYYALNMKDQAARDTLEALFCYMGEKLGDNKARVSNWTLGNEVNSCRAWNYSGNMSLQECVENYAQAFQLLYQGVKRTASTSRVFISLDHCWNTADAGHTGKEYLDAFAAYMAKTAPSMQWNVNYHPYSQPLRNNRFWSDGSHTVSNIGTAYISMKNIQVLTDYLGTLENKYHKQSGSIRVILGEMGYTARQGNGNEETEQAAALGYGYYIAMFNTRIDAYIIRAYIDDPSESRSGLYLGMFSSDYKRKQAYDVYKHLDKQDSLNYMNRYLSVIGISSWKSAIPGFDASKLPADDF